MTAVATVEQQELPVDFGRNFIPEVLTPLFHTEAWRQLEPRHRLRYNQLQARLLGWLVREFFSAPKRGQLRVVATLDREFPELQPLLPELKRQLLLLSADERYRGSIYSREVTPRSCARFDQWPEFRVLEQALPGYRYPGSQPA